MLSPRDSLTIRDAAGKGPPSISAEMSYSHSKINYSNCDER